MGQMIIGSVVMVWFAFRQEETLKPENKKPFNRESYIGGLKFFFKSEQAVIFTIILGFFLGGFLLYLSSIQQVFVNQYNMEKEFPYIFAINAIVIGISTLFNGMLVMKLGMRKLVYNASIIFSSVCLAFLIFFPQGENPTIITLMSYFLIMFLSYGFIFGNIVSVAMEPLGKIAGMGSALNGAISTMIGVAYANFMGVLVDNTARPIFLGFFISGTICILLITRSNYISKRKAKLELSK
jgi:DHA1 family bicyclomycin/chloramphenicol resistance-like MFS transporter